MYCSSCGVAVAQGLSYCNYCGATLSARKGDVSEPLAIKAESLVATMAAVFIFGLVAITVLMGVMKTVLNFNAGQILVFTMLSFLIMISLEGVFIRLLLHRKRGTQEAGDTVSKGPETKELNAPQARVLPEPVPSVTEHTTRAFNPIHTERSK